MTRLIDADALMNTIIKKSYTVTDYWNTRDSGMFLFGIEQAINEQPIIDAEPVVRCKDCKHKTDCFSEVAMTTKHQTTTIYEPIEWCSKGERKES